ncbi:MAG: MFS transporter [Opitutaceae bacterium]|nr:MFS transporter [Opitutaceae bacterium]
MKSNRNYLLLLAGQFLGAFGDNFILAAILGPLTYQQTSGQITEQYVNQQNFLFNVAFFVPFIFLAPLAGFLNDRMPKTAWLLGGNLLKLAGTAAGLLAVWHYQSQFEPSRLWQLASYGLIGIGACVYSPAKYGILPELLPVERLVKANGTVEMLTLVAIVGGLGAGGWVYDHFLTLPPCYLASLALYAAALAFNAAMDRTPCNPDAAFRHNLGEFGRRLLLLARHPRLFRVLLGCGMFWFAGATLRGNLQAWGLEVFREAGVVHITNFKLVTLKVGLVLGVVAGCELAGQFHRVGDLSWTRRYGLLMAAGVLLLGLLGGHWGLALVVVALVAAGGCGGLLIVPLNAALQAETDQSKLGKTVSIQNFFDYGAMAAGSVFLGLLTAFNLTPLQVFVALAAVLALIALALKIPERSTGGEAK